MIGSELKLRTALHQLEGNKQRLCGLPTAPPRASVYRYAVCTLHKGTGPWGQWGLKPTLPAKRGVLRARSRLVNSRPSLHGFPQSLSPF